MAAVIYTRISDDPRGKAAGVERQAAECRALAEARGIDVLESIEDNDLSATSGKRRPGFERVVDLVERRIVDTVIVWHTDRLYRLPRDLEPIIALADSRKLRFLTVTASEIDLNTPSGRMVARMLAAASAQEVEHKAERQRSASDQRASKGEPSSRPGYGFERDGDRVTAVPAEAAIIQEAAQRVLAGESLRGIAADLNAREVPPPGVREWTGTGVRRMLSKPSLAGLRVHRGAIVGEAVGDVILDLGTWDRLTALFADPSRKPNKVGRGPQHLLSGIALCGACGERVYRAPGWTPKPDSRTRHSVSPGYACPACRGVRRAQTPVDEFVTEVILSRLERPDALDVFAPRDDNSAAEARAELAAIDARLANAADSFADGAIDQAQLTRITARLREQRTVQEETLRRAAPPAVPLTAVGPLARDAWKGLDLDQRRAIIAALATVTIKRGRPGVRAFDPDTVRIEWRSAAA